MVSCFLSFSSSRGRAESRFPSLVWVQKCYLSAETIQQPGTGSCMWAGLCMPCPLASGNPGTSRLPILLLCASLARLPFLHVPVCQLSKAKGSNECT